MEEILLKIDELAKYHDQVSPDLIREKDIKPGLRNADGTGGGGGNHLQRAGGWL
ncbi:MAG: hypothetical protein ACOX2W_13690 [Desulfomonilia bacterium]